MDITKRQQVLTALAGGVAVLIVVFPVGLVFSHLLERWFWARFYQRG